MKYLINLIHQGSKSTLPLHKTSVIVNKALLARIEFLEADFVEYQSKLDKQEPWYFCITNIASNDSLIHFFTAFPCYRVFLCIFAFLGPSIHCLNYWGNKGTSKGKRNRSYELVIPESHQAETKSSRKRLGPLVWYLSVYCIEILHYLRVLSVLSSQRGLLDARC